MSFQQGMRAWLLQRLTAVYIALYSISLIVWLINHSPINYSTWQGLLSQPVILIATILFYLSLFMHAWLGVKDILIDYAKPYSVLYLLLTALALFLIVMTVWLLLIVISLVKV